ncbi:Noc2p family-domain-containing protein [Thamnocephalis sphaerospora]|uniref:Noc2p family-domain-containing protein n=1 Tax=Thamnocephalis sphaerospora TaxID=78915 RepID=A0A4P9XSS4_9FUNG|nr:Noc2p family-domain-containing protein [Thamnocephalis sphaerospora]|eukprot:RKP09022.1 Noc2p family-domain-containing protein [Thamnocephalis sphaerospora]
MGKVKKSVKKFGQTRLKQTIEKRRAVQKIKKERKKRELRKLGRAQLDKENEARAEGENLDEVGAFHTSKGGENDDGQVAAVLHNDSGSDLGSDLEADEDLLEDGDAVQDTSDEDNSDAEPSTKDPTMRKMLAEKHKKDLAKLKEQDPEFFRYLEDNDKQLLKFDVSESEEEEEEDDEEDEDDAEDAAAGSDDEQEMEEDGGYGQEVTKAVLAKWENAIIKEHSVRAGKQLAIAFRSAVLAGQEGADEMPYTVNSDAVFNKVILLSLKQLPGLFAHHLPVKQTKNQRTQPLPSGCKKWKVMRPLVKAFLANLLETIRRVSEPTIVQYVLQESERIITYFACFPKLAAAFLKELLNVWGTGHESTRMLAFVCIRRMAALPQNSMLDAALKGMYTTFVKVCRNTNAHTLPVINVLISCAVDMFGIDLSASYQHAFLYIRQLAIHLRGAIAAKSKEAYRSVYNWQFIHCLRFWSAVLSTYCSERFRAERGESPLQPMIYPFVQVALGASRLIPTAQYFPLRFHCIGLLTDLARNTGIFIPLAPVMFEVFDSTEMKRKPTPSTLKTLDFDVIIKAPKEYLHTRVYQEGLTENVCQCMFEYFESYALSIAFPELAIPAIVQLKRHIKRSKNAKISKQLQSVVEKLEQQSRFIENKRASTDFSPSELAKAHTFLVGTKVASTPLGAHLVSLRKIKEQRRQLLEENQSSGGKRR